MAGPGPKIAVVGAGIAGLSAAWRLASQDASVRVLEASSEVGGVLRTTKREGFVLEHAANGFLGSHERGALVLCGELGVPVEEAAQFAKKRWIVRGGALRELPASVRSLVSSDFMSPSGKLRLLAEPFIPAESGEVSVAKFFERRLGREAVDAVIAPFVTGIFAGDAEKLSLAAAFPRLAQLSRRGGLVRGKLVSLFEEGTRAIPKGSRRLWAPLEGMGALTAALREKLTGAVETDCGVTALAVRTDGVVLTTKHGEETFDAAVMATPAHVTAALLEAEAPELSSLLAGIEYVSVAAVHLSYARDQVAHALDGFGFLVAAGEAPKILGAVFESSIFSDRVPSGQVLIRCMYGGSRDGESARLGEAELAGLAHRELSQLLSIRGEPSFSSVVSWPRAIPQYHMGHIDRVARADAMAFERKLVLAGNPYRGVAINDCIFDADRVAADAQRLLVASF